jgi:hypothetical protein
MTAIPEGVMGPSEDGWLPPPTGPSPEAGSEEPQVKVTQAEMNATVDRLLIGVRKLLDGLAAALNEEEFKAQEAELWAYGELIQVAIKKFKLQNESVIFLTCGLVLLGVWASRLIKIAQKRMKPKPPVQAARQPPPPEAIAAFEVIDKQAEGTAA